MGPDICVPCGGGVVNIRVGAIILKDGRFLMVKNARAGYFYSVGGRIKFGETAEEAVVREVEEETGIRLAVDRLGFVQENYFYGDAPSTDRFGKVYYELAFYFYMKTPADFEPVCRSFTEDGVQESLEWVSPDEPRTVYPDFFRTALDPEDRAVRHMVKDDRFDRARVKLTVVSPEYTGFDRVILVSPKDKNKREAFALTELGGGEYAICYNGNKLPAAGYKGGTVKLQVFLDGNLTATPNATLSVSVKLN